jgi:hypothetical protein
MKKQLDLIKQFCYIQLQVIKDRELRLKKELQECLIQKEFVKSIIEDLGEFIVSQPPPSEEN